MPRSPTLPHPVLVDTLDRQAREHDLAGQLRRAAHRPHHPAEMLGALARLDPTGAVEWLAAQGADARALIGDDPLRRLLDTLAADVATMGDVEATARLASVAAAAGDAASPDALAALAAALPPARVAGGLAAALERRLDRHHAHPGLLRAAAAAATHAEDADAAHALLTRLGRADPSPATAQHIRRARAALPDPPGPRARVALLSSFTVEPLVPWLDLECRAGGVVPEIHVAPFNSWERELRDPGAALRPFAPEIVFLAVSVDDLLPALAGAPDDDALRRGGDEAVVRVASAVGALRGWSDAPVVVLAFHSAFRDPAGIAATRGGRSRAAWLAGCNARLGERLAEVPDTYLLDLPELLQRRPGGAAEEPKLRHLARIRLGHAVLPELARACAAYVVPLKGLTRKCVVLDLDNTLWGGVVGEDGPAGIRLGETAPGSEFVEFQRWLLALRERGTLLAVASKNNEEDALAVLRGHDAMLLREEHFSALRVNWPPKPQNLVSIARELGIGVDALVFVDDNPGEREAVRRALPGVLVPELPADPSLYRATLEALPQLGALRVTEEDRERAALYRARREREEARAGAASLDDFLHALEVRAVVEPASDATLPRLHQLFARTNQFNLTTRRHDAALLAARAADPGWRLLALRAADRYADHGLVGAALVHADGEGWAVESLLLSCRAIGLGLETALLAAVADAARAAGARHLAGEFVPTPKNGPARDFWARHGFARAGGEEGGAERWTLDLRGGSVPPPPWIRLTVHHAS